MAARENRRGLLNPPMGQVFGGWVGAMVLLGIAGGYLFGPAEVTLHVTSTPPASGAPCAALASAGREGPLCPLP